MKIHVLDLAVEDLLEGYSFYENQEQGVGTYFLGACRTLEIVARKYSN